MYDVLFYFLQDYLLRLGLLKGNSTGVDELLIVLNHTLDLTLLLEASNDLAGEAGVDLQTIGDNGDGNDLVAGHFLVHLLLNLVIENHSLLSSLLGLGLSPLLQKIKKCVRHYERNISLNGKETIQTFFPPFLEAEVASLAFLAV